MKVTAKARRSGGWWAVEVPEVPGAFTQAKRLEQVAGAAAEAVADLLEVAAADVEVTLAPVLAEDVEHLVAEARTAAGRAAEAQAVASALMRSAVATLRVEQALTTRDTAELLGVTPQRVSQLEHTA